MLFMHRIFPCLQSVIIFAFSLLDACSWRTRSDLSLFVLAVWLTPACISLCNLRAPCATTLRITCQDRNGVCGPLIDFNGGRSIVSRSNCFLQLPSRVSPICIDHSAFFPSGRDWHCTFQVLVTRVLVHHSASNRGRFVKLGFTHHLLRSPYTGEGRDRTANRLLWRV